jgi:hypothetical protein
MGGSHGNSRQGRLVFPAVFPRAGLPARRDRKSL